MSIKKQVEFYFSDSNFRKDKFLSEKAAEDGEGFVSIETLLTFNRLKALVSGDGEAVKEVATALQDSKTVVVSEDGLKLRRAEALPEDKDSNERTLYVKGFPEGDSDVTVESVREQFSNYGNILMVRLRKDHITKAFKGNCFIEYDNVDAVNKAIAESHDADGKVTLKYGETPFLCIMPLVQWLANKAAKRGRRNGGTGASTGEKRKREGNDEADIKDGQDVPRPVEFVPGQIMKVTNVPSDATLYQIKDKFKTVSEVRYVDFEVGDTTAIVRFSNVEAAAKAVSAVAAGMKLLDTEEEANIEAVLLEGEEETAYWEKISKNQANHGGPRNKRGGRGRGGRGFKKSRR